MSGFVKRRVAQRPESGTLDMSSVGCQIKHNDGRVRALLVVYDLHPLSLSLYIYWGSPLSETNQNPAVPLSYLDTKMKTKGLVLASGVSVGRLLFPRSALQSRSASSSMLKCLRAIICSPKPQDDSGYECVRQWSPFTAS